MDRILRVSLQGASGFCFSFFFSELEERKPTFVPSVVLLLLSLSLDGAKRSGRKREKSSPQVEVRTTKGVNVNCLLAADESSIIN